MDTNTFIKQSINQHVHEAGKNIHDTSAAYIDYLLKSVLEPISNAINKQQIITWMANNFGLNISDSLQVEMKNKEMDIINTFLQRGNFTSEEEEKVGNLLLQDPKDIIFDYLIKQIIKSTVRTIKVNTFLPWDIRTSIGNDQLLSNLLNLPPADIRQVTLPVNVSIDREYVLDMTEEFTCGLLLYSDVAHISFRTRGIRMFGADFYSSYMAGNNRFTHNTRKTYSVKVANRVYNFNTIEFMQGFATGALWSGTNHRDYWSDLIDYSNDPAGVKVEF